MRRGWITPLAFMYTYIGQTFIHQPVGELFKSFQYKMIEYIFVLKRGDSCFAIPHLLNSHTAHWSKFCTVGEINTWHKKCIDIFYAKLLTFSYQTGCRLMLHFVQHFEEYCLNFNRILGFHFLVIKKTLFYFSLHSLLLPL